MQKKLLYLAIACAVAATVSVRAQDSVSVTNYNWLQLRPAEVTTLIGGGVGGASGYGAPDFYRWGEHAWIPDGALTSNGVSMYWAGLRLDQPRNVQHVAVQWWAIESTAISNYFIDASPDGSSWTTIGAWTNTSMKTGTRFIDDVDVIDGDYRYVRVRILPGAYVYANAARGGPGLYAIEPFGTGTVLSTSVNWANKPNFSTVASINGLSFNGTRFNDGRLYDDEAIRTGNNPGNWDTTDYAQIDLGAIRWIDTMIAVADFGWKMTNFSVQVSLDGSIYTTAANLQPRVSYAALGAVERRFDTTRARYVRLTDAKTDQSYALLNQILVLGGPVPPPKGTTIMVK
jgi:hypothetical protein